MVKKHTDYIEALKYIINKNEKIEDDNQLHNFVNILNHLEVENKKIELFLMKKIIMKLKIKMINEDMELEDNIFSQMIIIYGY